eukprot:gene16041-biopygen25037
MYPNEGKGDFSTDTPATLMMRLRASLAKSLPWQPDAVMAEYYKDALRDLAIAMAKSTVSLLPKALSPEGGIWIAKLENELASATDIYMAFRLSAITAIEEWRKAHIAAQQLLPFRSQGFRGPPGQAPYFPQGNRYTHGPQFGGSGSGQHRSQFGGGHRRSAEDPQDFQAGGLRDRVDVWKAFFDLAGIPAQTQRRKQVVSWLTSGVNLKQLPVRHPSQLSAPFRAKKIRVVKALLTRVLPPGSLVDKYLENPEPLPVVFPNHPNTLVHKDFVEEEVKSLLSKGVIRRPLYPNLFWEYTPLHYESLTDIPPISQPGDFAFTTDDKSGYFHVPLHPDMWKDLAFIWDGETFCFTHLPFGVGPACSVYTRIQEAVISPLRDLGLRIIFLLDGKLGLDTSQSRTQWMAIWVAKLLACLGFTLSIQKCQLKASQLPRFLGMNIDLGSRAFMLPEDKRVALLALMEEMTTNPAVTDRQIAKLAGN